MLLSVFGMLYVICKVCMSVDYVHILIFVRLFCLCTHVISLTYRYIKRIKEEKGEKILRALGLGGMSGTEV